ncbi:MAG: hypothetical protein JSW61_13380 [Candidatus Thorarchaeota archaeon]|nr:MAG: hypothetical protein JSW61_13380 [Candidatus Thorarchaeota archaeon]
MIRSEDARKVADSLPEPLYDRYEFELRQKLASNPLDYHLWFMLGLHLGASEKLEEAEYALQNSLKINPEYGPALWELAYIYERAGRSASADVLWSRVRERRLRNLECVWSPDGWL